MFAKSNDISRWIIQEICRKNVRVREIFGRVWSKWRRFRHAWQYAFLSRHIASLLLCFKTHNHAPKRQSRWHAVWKFPHHQHAASWRSCTFSHYHKKPRNQVQSTSHCHLWAQWTQPVLRISHSGRPYRQNQTHEKHHQWLQCHLPQVQHQLRFKHAQPRILRIIRDHLCRCISPLSKQHWRTVVGQMEETAYIHEPVHWLQCWVIWSATCRPSSRNHCCECMSFIGWTGNRRTHPFMHNPSLKHEPNYLNPKRREIYCL